MKAEAKHCPHCGALHNYPHEMCLICETHQAARDMEYSWALGSFKQRLDAADARKEQAEREEEKRRKSDEEDWEDINCFAYALRHSDGVKDGKEWVYLGFSYSNVPVNEKPRFKLTPAAARAMAQRLMQVADDVDANLRKLGMEVENGKANS